MAFLPMFLFMFLFGFIFGYLLAISVIIIKVKAGVHWSVFVNTFHYTIPVLLIYAVIFSFIITWFYPCIITSAGIYGYTFWGMRRHFGWAEIGQVKKISLVNLRFLRLYNNAGQAMIWLPLFQSRSAEFLETTRKFAPPNHPVLSHLG